MDQNAFQQYLLQEGMAENSVKTYVGHAGRYAAWYLQSFSDAPTALHRENFLDFRAYLINVRRLSPASVNQYISALAKLNEFLVGAGIQGDTVISKRDYLKTQRPMTDPWDGKEEEVAQLRQALLTTPPRYTGQNKRDHAIVTVMANAGLRVSEVVSLRLDDMSLENQQLRVRGKGNKGRIVFINQKVVNAVGEYLRVRDSASQCPYVFLSRRGGRLDRSQVNRILSKVSDTIHPHMLRHFYCSQTQKKAGFTLAETANQAGHASTQTTLRYTHPDISEMKEKVEKL